MFNILRIEVDKQLDLLSNDPNLLTLSTLRHLIKKAISEGLNVSDVEAKIPELEKKALKLENEKWYTYLSGLIKEPIPNYPNLMRDLDGFKYTVEVAKKAEVDVSDIEAKMPELEKQVLQIEVKRLLELVSKLISETPLSPMQAQSGIKYGYIILKNTVEVAKKAEVDVSDIEAKMPELEKQVLQIEVKRLLRIFRQESLPINLAILKDAIEKAKEAGVNVSDIEAEITVQPKTPDLKRQVLQEELECWLSIFRQEPYTIILAILKDAIEKAKEAGVNVSDIEARTTILIKQYKVGSAA